MKKAKWMLTILAIAAAVSSTLAFKAQRSFHILYVGPLGSGVCTIEYVGAALGEGPLNCAASTVPLTEHCPDVYTYKVDD